MSLFLWAAFGIIKNLRMSDNLRRGSAVGREVIPVNKKLFQLLAPRFGLYFLVMIAFAVGTLLLNHVKAGVAELIVVAVLFALYCVTMARRRKEAASYLEQLVGSMDGAHPGQYAELPPSCGHVPAGH